MDRGEEAKEHLLARLAALERRVGRLTTDLGEPLERDAEEQATQRENEDVATALDDAGRRELAAIRSALARIEAGTYGLCRSCGEPIGAERLRAVPTALECLDCAGQAS